MEGEKEGDTRQRKGREGKGGREGGWRKRKREGR